MSWQSLRRIVQVHHPFIDAQSNEKVADVIYIGKRLEQKKKKEKGNEKTEKEGKGRKKWIE